MTLQRSDPYAALRVLITGGTGSFGHAMAARLLRSDCREVRIFSRDEVKQEQMRHRLPDRRLRFFLGDTRDRASIDRAVQGVDLVFHAAALKQVPSCEFFPIEAVRTNVLGSDNVLASAVAAGVRRVVCLSTDKAVYPINAMGMSKALMEKAAQAASRPEVSGSTTICIVRYGNVLYSRGSVVPRFIDQLRQGNPLTVTHPDMTRFLLRMEDALDLVDFAFEHGAPGEILIKRSPASTVATLARAVQQIFSGPERISVIGIRHGEKMHETLAAGIELVQAVERDGFVRLPLDGRDLNYDLYYQEGLPAPMPPDYTSAAAHRLEVDEVVELLMGVPEIRALQPTG